MRVVVALGGRALLPRRSPRDGLLRADVRAVALALAPAAVEHELVVCHATTRVPNPAALPVAAPDDATAAQQGVVGHWLARELAAAGVPAPVVVVVSRVLASDVDDALGAGQPLRVEEVESIRLLADRGTLVVCGAGVPVRPRGARPTAAGAGVDVDATATLLALELDADRLLLLTDVDGVRRVVGPSGELTVRRASVAEMRALRLPPTTMGAKVAAGIRFVTGTGRPAIIGAVEDVEALLAGRAGTSVYLDWPGPAAGR